MANAKPLDPRTLRWAARLARRRAGSWQHVPVPDSFTINRSGAFISFARDLESELRKALRRPSRARPKWSKAKLLAHITRAPSQIAVARALKGSAGAIRKRCLKDPELKKLWLALGARSASHTKAFAAVVKGPKPTSATAKILTGTTPPNAAQFATERLRGGR